MKKVNNYVQSKDKSYYWLKDVLLLISMSLFDKQNYDQHKIKTPYDFYITWKNHSLLK